jgi:hypothetical protein
MSSAYDTFSTFILQHNPYWSLRGRRHLHGTIFSSGFHATGSQILIHLLPVS